MKIRYLFIFLCIFLLLGLVVAQTEGTDNQIDMKVEHPGGDAGPVDVETSDGDMVELQAGSVEVEGDKINVPEGETAKVDGVDVGKSEGGSKGETEIVTKEEDFDSSEGKTALVDDDNGKVGVKEGGKIEIDSESVNKDGKKAIDLEEGESVRAEAEEGGEVKISQDKDTDELDVEVDEGKVGLGDKEIRDDGDELLMGKDGENLGEESPDGKLKQKGEDFEGAKECDEGDEECLTDEESRNGEWTFRQDEDGNFYLESPDGSVTYNKDKINSILEGERITAFKGPNKQPFNLYSFDSCVACQHLKQYLTLDKKLGGLGLIEGRDFVVQDIVKDPRAIKLFERYGQKAGTPLIEDPSGKLGAYTGFNENAKANVAGFVNAYQKQQAVINVPQQIPRQPTQPNQIPIPDYNKLRSNERKFVTDNFIVNSPSGNAKAYAAALEYSVRQQAINWRGAELPNGAFTKVNVNINEGNMGGGGATSFIFDNRGNLNGVKMDIQGNYNRLIDSVIPHEATHIVNNAHFGQPLPRWIDEGICSSGACEAAISRGKMNNVLVDSLKTNRGLPFNQMLKLKQYPRDILPLYAQGTSAVEFLIQEGGGGIQGQRKLYGFLGEVMSQGDGTNLGVWNNALNKHYNYGNKGLNNAAGDFQQRWLRDLQGKIQNRQLPLLYRMLLVVIK